MSSLSAGLRRIFRRRRDGEVQTVMSDRYPGYTEADLQVFDGLTRPPSAPQPGFVVNYLGVRTRVSYIRGAEPLDGRVIAEPPVPDDGFHAEAIEFIGMMKSVRQATSRYRILELGAGWGPWVSAACFAARQAGIGDIHGHAVEADPGHFGFLGQHMRDNGMDDGTCTLLHAAVGESAGEMLFPKVADPAADWGARPEAASGGHSDYRGIEHDGWLKVDVVSLADLLAAEPAWDLVHFDIQGGEYDICRSAADLLTRKVRFMVIATHSPKIHGDLIELFFRQGWVLENEKPPKFNWREDARDLTGMIALDGTQVWRNPRNPA